MLVLWQTRQPGKYVKKRKYIKKRTCPGQFLLALSKMQNIVELLSIPVNFCSCLIMTFKRQQLYKELRGIPVQEMESTPGPKYSTIAPVPPFTVKMPATLRITSAKENQH